jgi:hypothetical protein
MRANPFKLFPFRMEGCPEIAASSEAVGTASGFASTTGSCQGFTMIELLIHCSLGAVGWSWWLVVGVDRRDGHGKWLLRHG